MCLNSWHLSTSPPSTQFFNLYGHVYVGHPERSMPTPAKSPVSAHQYMYTPLQLATVKGVMVIENRYCDFSLLVRLSLSL